MMVVAKSKQVFLLIAEQERTTRPEDHSLDDMFCLIPLPLRITTSNPLTYTNTVQTIYNPRM